MSDELTGKVKEAGQEALERGKSVAQDAVGAAAETARERGGEELDGLSTSVQQKAEEITDVTRPSGRGADDVVGRGAETDEESRCACPMATGRRRRGV